MAVSSHTRDGTAETHESSTTFLHVNCSLELEVAFDDREPARRIVPCKRKTANGTNAEMTSPIRSTKVEAFSQ